MRASSFIAAAMVLLAFSGPAWACGLCHEDNRAAVYSWDAAQKVAAAPDRLEFVVLKVVGPLPQATADSIVQWLKSRPGVDPTTVKISTLQKSTGFVFERSKDKTALISEMKNAFPGLVFHVLKYDDTHGSNHEIGRPYEWRPSSFRDSSDIDAIRRSLPSSEALPHNGLESCRS